LVTTTAWCLFWRNSDGLISKLASSDKGKFLWRGGHTMNENINWALNVKVMVGPKNISGPKTMRKEK